MGSASGTDTRTGSSPRGPGMVRSSTVRSSGPGPYASAPASDSSRRVPTNAGAGVVGGRALAASTTAASSGSTGMAAC